MLVVPTKIGARGPLAAKQHVRPCRHIHHGACDFVRDLGGADVHGEPVRIFRGIVVEARIGLQFGDRERLAADHRDRQFAALDKGLREQLVELLPRAGNVATHRVSVIAFLGDDGDPNRGSLVHRLHDIGPRKWVFLVKALAADDPSRGHPDPVRHEHHLGQFLVDGDDRRRKAAMRIFQAHEIHHALDGAIFAGCAVKRIEDDVGLQLRETSGDVAVHVELGDVRPAALAQRRLQPPCRSSATLRAPMTSRP